MILLPLSGWKRQALLSRCFWMRVLYLLAVISYFCARKTMMYNISHRFFQEYTAFHRRIPRQSEGSTKITSIFSNLNLIKETNIASKYTVKKENVSVSPKLHFKNLSPLQFWIHVCSGRWKWRIETCSCNKVTLLAMMGFSMLILQDNEKELMNYFRFRSV